MNEAEVYVIFTKEVTQEEKDKTIEFYQSRGFKVMIGFPIPPKK
jgi:hypothetical protein